MSQNFIRSTAIVIALALSACANPNGLNGTGNNAGASSTYLAVCQLSNAQGPVVCIDFPADNSANSATCTTVEYPNYQSAGANSEEYQGVGSSANASTSCAMFNPNVTRVGTCSMADRYVRYYSAFWSVTSAQKNCATRAGQWGG